MIYASEGKDPDRATPEWADPLLAKAMIRANRPDPKPEDAKV